MRGRGGFETRPYGHRRSFIFTPGKAGPPFVHRASEEWGTRNGTRESGFGDGAWHGSPNLVLCRLADGERRAGRNARATVPGRIDLLFRGIYD
jgi:hypothetical protein